MRESGMLKNIEAEVLERMTGSPERMPSRTTRTKRRKPTETSASAALRRLAPPCAALRRLAPLGGRGCNARKEASGPASQAFHPKLLVRLRTPYYALLRFGPRPTQAFRPFTWDALERLSTLRRSESQAYLREHRSPQIHDQTANEEVEMRQTGGLRRTPKCLLFALWQGSFGHNSFWPLAACRGRFALREP